LLEKNTHMERTIKVSTNLATYRSENNFVGPNNYVERSNVNDKTAKSFNILATKFECLT